MRRGGGLLAILTLIGVFPANLKMALNANRFPDVPRPALWARLPFQLVFVAWVLAAMKPAQRG